MKRILMRMQPSLAVLALFIAGCGDPPITPAGCPEGHEIAGICTGVPQTPICDTTYCTSGVTCSKTTNVASDAELQSAIAVAMAGECIALAAGSYSTANLPGGVSLLGASASSTNITGITLGAGKGAFVRGLSVGAGGIVVDGAMGASIASVEVSNANNDGIEVRANSWVEVRTSTITGAKRYGISTTDATSVTIDQCFMSGNTGAGLWAMGSGVCPTMPTSMITVKKSVFRGNYLLGVSLQNVDATLDHVDVVESTGDPGQLFKGGAGMAVSQCSKLDGKAVRIMQNKEYGVLVDQSQGRLGGPTATDGVEISDNRIGIWVRGTSEIDPFTLDQALVKNNRGVGMGASGIFDMGMMVIQTRGFIVCNAIFEDTQMEKLSVFAGGEPGAVREDVGDGFVWLDGSDVAIDSATFSNNARNSLLINGSATGKISNIKLQGGDDVKRPILQQNFDGMTQPSDPNGLITTDMAERFAVPAAPASL